SRARCQTSTSRRRARTWKTTPNVTWEGVRCRVLDSTPGFRPIVVNHSRKVGMTKPLSLPAVLLVVLLLVVAGCGSSGKKSGSGTTTSATNTTSASGKKIGLVTDVGGLNDKGFNHLAYVGLQTAKGRLGVQTKVNLSQSSSEYVPNMTAFVRQGYD